MACWGGAQEGRSRALRPSATEADPSSLNLAPLSASHAPPLPWPPLRALVGEGKGDLQDQVTQVTGHHLTCNMTQVKLKPADRVPVPTLQAQAGSGPVALTAEPSSPLL